MKKLFPLLLMFISISCFAQTNSDKAKAAYFKADENFQATNYQGCIDKLNEAIELLGSGNARIQYLMVKSYKELGNYNQVKIELGKYFSFNPNVDDGYKEMLKLSDEVDVLIKQKEDAEALQKKQLEKDKLESETWNSAINWNSRSYYELYIAQYPRGKHIQEANERLEKIIYDDAFKFNTIEKWNNYLKKFPNGKNKATAELNIGILEGKIKRKTETNTIIEKEINDIEGNVYKVVVINNKVWMAENLATTKFNDGTAIPLLEKNKDWRKTTAAAYCWYNNEVSIGKTFSGALYNWYAVNTNKLCPEGWRVPSRTEFTNLVDYFGGETAAGGKLKSNIYPQKIRNGYTVPQKPTNIIDFAGLMGGWREGGAGEFNFFGESGNFWSATEDKTEYAYYLSLYMIENTVGKFSRMKNYGFSVRCVKDK